MRYTYFQQDETHLSIPLLKPAFFLSCQPRFSSFPFLHFCCNHYLSTIENKCGHSTFMKQFFKHHPMAAVLAGAFFISFSSVWVKLSDVTPASSAFYRVFFGFLFLLCASLYLRQFVLPSLKRTFWITICSFIFAMDLILWHGSIQFIGPGLATILGNFQVFLMALTGIIFLGEPFRTRLFVAIPLAVSGLFLIVGLHWQELGETYKAGIYLGLGTALCYTIFLLLLRKLQTVPGKGGFINTLLFISFGCSIFLGTEMIVTKQSFSIPDLPSLSYLLFLGLFSQTIGWLLIANALPKIPVSFTGMFLLLQPSLAFLWDVLLFARPTSLLNWTGVVITLSAIYLGVSSKKKKTQKACPKPS